MTPPFYKGRLGGIFIKSSVIKHGFSIGRVHVLEQQMLLQNDIERLIEAKDITQMVHILSETAYAPYVADIRDENDIEEALTNYLDDLSILSDELLGEADKKKIPLFVKLARVDIDLVNIRIYLREGISGEHFEEGGFIDKNMFMSTDINSIIKKLYPLLAQKIIDEEEISEKDLDDTVLTIIKQYKQQPVIADRIIAFLKAKYFEVKNVRLLLLTGLNNLRREKIEQNLRILYA